MDPDHDDFDPSSSTSTEDSGKGGVISSRELVKLRMRLVQQDISRAADSGVELLKNLRDFPPEARLEDVIRRLDDMIPRVRGAVDLTAQLLDLIISEDPPAAD